MIAGMASLTWGCGLCQVILLLYDNNPTLTVTNYYYCNMRETLFATTIVLPKANFRITNGRMH